MANSWALSSLLVLAIVVQFFREVLFKAGGSGF